MPAAEGAWDGEEGSEIRVVRKKGAYRTGRRRATVRHRDPGTGEFLEKLKGGLPGRGGQAMCR